MAPRIDSLSSYGLWSQKSEKEKSVTGVMRGALGAGQVSALREELLLPCFIAPPAASFRAALPRFAGGLLSIAATGYDLMKAYKADQNRSDSSYRETRRQIATSALSTSAGLGIGSLAGAAAAGVLVAGGPTIAATAISVAGVAAAGIAASYVYDWASERVAAWIP